MRFSLDFFRRFTLATFLNISVFSAFLIDSLILPDKIYNEQSTNQQLFENEAKPIVEQVVKGYNGTIFAYGQTSSGEFTHFMHMNTSCYLCVSLQFCYYGDFYSVYCVFSGKTFTMLGDKRNPGVIRLAARQIFKEISMAGDGLRSFVIRYVNGSFS